jgi:tetratricopeptide (TPR) repeat protein
MEDTSVDQLWQRLLKGQPTALVGLSSGEPPASLNLSLLRVSCDGPRTTLGPLLAARRKAEIILDLHTPLIDQTRRRLVVGLRRRFLGDLPAREEEVSLVEVWNRLAQQAPRPVALLFDAVDAADKPTLEVLRRIVSRPGWLKLPLLLVFRTPDPTGAAGALLEALRTAAGPESVVQAPHPPTAPPSPAAAPADRAPSPAVSEPSAAALTALPPDVLRILRIGAVLGSGCEVELVAAVLGTDPLLVVDALQRAADAGVPLEDRGEGRIYLPAPVIEALRASTLPSLSLLLHRRVAALLMKPPASEERVERAPEPELASEPARAVPQTDDLAAEPPARETAADALEDETVERKGGWPYAEIFAGTAIDPEERAPAVASPQPKEAPRPRLAVTSPTSVSADAARAAGHLAAAGEIEASAERYLAAAQQAAAMGATAQAMSHGKTALQLLADLPDSRKRRLLRIAVLLEFGRLQWHAAGPANAANGEPRSTATRPDETFTLAGALEVLEAAKSGLRPDDPTEIAAAASSLIAGVCYDLGDLRSLERALDELSSATRLLLGAGDATGAARLLNDQAAVYVRLGDPVRAAHLLGESRKIFEERAAKDPVAMIEMAETDHLFARIPLHVPARPGREEDALSMGLDHAIAAERTYQRVGDGRELARVWETMGRLELRKGRLERASQRLAAAAEIQTQIGDLVGLARSTAALSEVLAANGRYRDALSLLGDSVTFNSEKGSPIGLAFNRRALDALVRTPAVSKEAGAALSEVRSRLLAAESELGRLTLPGERDAA